MKDLHYKPYERQVNPLVDLYQIIFSDTEAAHFPRPFHFFCIRTEEPGGLTVHGVAKESDNSD